LFVLAYRSFFRFSFSNSVGQRQSNFPIRSDGIFLASSSPESLFANSPIPDILRSNASLKPNWRRPFHALNSVSQSDPANLTAQVRGNASVAINKVLPGTTTKDIFVSQQAPRSVPVNSESVSNEIDESDFQYE
jgi:hypothetical protein